MEWIALSYLAMWVIGWNGAKLARNLRMTRSGVSLAMNQVEALVRESTH
jgi:hypothetical protein